MKNINKIITFAIGMLLVALSSCDLDREPNDYISFDKSYNNMKDAKMWDNGIYSTLRGKFGGAYILPQEIQADMLSAHETYSGLYGTFHGWTVKAENDVIKEVYHSYYAALLDANIVIDKIPTLKVNDDDKAQLDVFLGDAYFARAFYNFNLALRWAMPYNEATANTDLGIALETKPFDLEKPARATNSQTYSLILEDLKKAESFLSLVKGKEGNEEISRDVVIALRSRVYLYMGNMEKALEESEKLINFNTYPLIDALPEGMKDPEGKTNPFVEMWQLDNGKEQIWLPYVNKPNEIPTTISLYGADMGTWQYWKEKGVDNKDFNRPTYLPTGTVMYQLFNDENDRRIPAYFEDCYTTINDKEDQAVVFVISKFKGNPKHKTLDSEHWGGYVPNGICSPKPFRIAEQYLIASEAAFETKDESKAMFYLNILKKSRGLKEINLKGEELLNAIRQEKAREMCFEGFRLWDLRRWHMPVNERVRQGMVKEHIVPARFFSSDFDFFKSIPADNPKFVWGFPRDEVAQINKNIIQNKGW